MKLLKTIDPDPLPEGQWETFSLRRTARAVVLNDQQYVAVLYVQKYGYYTLPGGGLESGEDPPAAAMRECLEEIGCPIRIDQEIGMTIEYRGKKRIKQESFCFLAHLAGPIGTPRLTEGEMTEGLVTLWVSIDQAIRLVEQATTENYEGTFIIPRESAFLREARKILSQKEN